jgi:hypothetical protein
MDLIESYFIIWMITISFACFCLPNSTHRQHDGLTDQLLTQFFFVRLSIQLHTVCWNHKITYSLQVLGEENQVHGISVNFTVTGLICPSRTTAVIIVQPWICLFKLVMVWCLTTCVVWRLYIKVRRTILGRLVWRALFLRSWTFIDHEHEQLLRSVFLFFMRDVYEPIVVLWQRYILQAVVCFWQDATFGSNGRLSVSNSITSSNTQWFVTRRWEWFCGRRRPRWRVAARVIAVDCRRRWSCPMLMRLLHYIVFPILCCHNMF